MDMLSLTVDGLYKYHNWNDVIKYVGNYEKTFYRFTKTILGI